MSTTQNIFPSIMTPQKRNQGSTTTRTRSSSKGKLGFSSHEKFDLRTSTYTSMNISYLLGSELKFKSPSKLISMRISDSPWLKRNDYDATHILPSDHSPIFKSTDKKPDASQNNQYQHAYQNLQERFSRALETAKENEP